MGKEEYHWQANRGTRSRPTNMFEPSRDISYKVPPFSRFLAGLACLTLPGGSLKCANTLVLWYII
jgi:hypothetical protein